MAVTEIVVVNTTSTETIVNTTSQQTVIDAVTSPLKVEVLAGEQGVPGPANTLSIGTVTASAPGSSPVATITGAAPTQTLSLTLPRGDTGPVNTLTMGTVTQLYSGQTPTSSITGTAPNQTLTLGLPKGAEILSGAGAPAGATGSQNDWYINTSTWDMSKKTGASTWTTQLNIRGAIGPANTLTVNPVTTLDSTQAPTVVIGGTSPNQNLTFSLPKGAEILSGAGAPAGALGSIGDLYINTTTWDMSRKTASTTWTFVLNIRGATGPAPNLAIGTTTTGAAGSAAAATITGTNPNYSLNLTIPKGDIGAQWYSGTGAPSGALGVVNDYYVVTGGTVGLGDVYRKTGASAWTLQGNIRGAAGMGNVSSTAGAVGNLLTYAAADGSLIQDAGFAASDVVRLTQAQTITGAKTFSANTTIANADAAATYLRIGNSSTGAAGIVFDAINADFAGVDYTLLRQETGPTGNFTIRNYVGNIEFYIGNVGSPTVSINGTGIVGPGSGITTLNGSNISSGTVADARLSSNVFLLNTAQTVTAETTFSGNLAYTNTSSEYHYNTTDRVTNFERIRKYWSGNAYMIETQSGGTGSNVRDIVINSAATELRTSQTGVYVRRSGTSIASLMSIESTGLASSSGQQSGLSIATTITQTGTAGYDLLKINATHSTVGTGAKNLITAQLGGVNKFIVDSDGDIIIGAPASASSSTATPQYISIGNTFGSNAAGALGNLKLKLFESSTSSFGFGISVNRMEYQVPGGAVHTFYVNGSQVAELNPVGVSTNGSQITALNGSNISTGTVADARLSSNVNLLNAAQTVSGIKTFSAAPVFNAGYESLTNTTIRPINYASNQALDGVRVTTRLSGSSYFWESRFGLASDSGGGPRAGIRLITRDTSNVVTNDIEPVTFSLSGPSTFNYPMTLAGNTRLTLAHVSNVAEGIYLSQAAAASDSPRIFFGANANAIQWSMRLGQADALIFSSAATIGTTSGTQRVAFMNTGEIVATSFNGSGASLTNLNGANISTGQIPVARMGTGTADSSRFLRGDGTWSNTVSVPGLTNDTPTGLFAINGGTDGTLGATVINIGVNTSATAGNRYGFISVGDTIATRTLVLNRSSNGSYGNVNVGFATTKESRLTIVASGNPATPTLGSGTNTSLQISNSDSTYGTVFGTAGTGVGWIQQMRTDGTATAYNILLQPSGGNVGIGGTAATEKLDVTGNIKASGTVTSAGTGFAGPGVNITTLNASNLSTGIIPIGRMLSGFIQNSSSTFQNYYAKICTATITAQYGDVNTVIQGIAGGSGTTNVSGPKIHFRVKQQSAMASPPQIDVDIEGNPSYWTASLFTAVTTVNTAGSTVVELWCRYPQTFETLYFYEIARMNSGSTSLSFAQGETPLVSLPAGTQTVATYAPVEDARLSSNVALLNATETITGSWTFSTSPTINASALNMTNGTSNLINMGAAGVNPPTFSSRSAGTKVVLYQAIGASSGDYAIGIEGSHVWNSVPTSSSTLGFKWYGGTTNIARLDGTGSFILPKSTATTSDSNLILGDDIAVVSATGRTKMLVGNTAGDSELFMGQAALNNLVLAWKYNATAASAYALIETYGGSNLLALQVTGGNIAVGKTTAGTKLDVNGTVTATAFAGSGASITSLSGSNISTGTISPARLGTGASATTFLRGDSTFQTLTLADVPDAWVKRAVRVASTANITLPPGGTALTIDGIALANGDRVLVKNNNPAQNGIYIVSGIGSSVVLTRATDADAASEVAGATVSIDQGTQGGQMWSTTFKSTDTVGTTAMNWYRVLDTNSGVDLASSQTITGTKTFSTVNTTTVTSTATTNSLNVQRFEFTVATAARPTGTKYVEWVGPVQPNNALTGDTWVSTA